MQTYQYKVVPAPKRGLKARGVSSNEDRFAHALEVVMNDLGAQGWDYVRADTLPAEERQGLTGRVTVYQNMLVFRRVVEVVAEAARPDFSRILQAPAIVAAAAVPIVAPVAAPPVAPVVRLVDHDATVVAAPVVGVRLVGE